MGERRVRYEREEKKAMEISRFYSAVRPCSENLHFWRERGKGRREGTNLFFVDLGSLGATKKPAAAKDWLSHILLVIPQASMGGDFSASGPNHASAMLLLVVSVCCYHPFISMSSKSR